MDPYDKRSPFVTVYLFENGEICEPVRLRIRENEFDKFFPSDGKFRYQHKKAQVLKI